ncbi:tRNA uridine-5-carboxymethylaminomethyl(34) synthesis GTPase MnmE [Vicingus serpentipes]|uniref:tRNA uridine-5-carboxymethylaminomethyl(34) synthesis GTPase MnmE n=1 Tax=Vicingus serpentipes TaxID=1926625 RepID=UPI001CB8D225|nr:tRNA uridine-5-carboxymethylaminomethyl(34) synthesis GTPase MnmE [Vicingus serpentipes]
MQTHNQISDSICAIATAPGIGAIAVIRLSGADAINISNKVFFGKDITQVESHTAHFGTIRDGEKIVDEVLVTVFKGKKSFTGENSVEISTHGSPYIQQQVLQLLLKNGAKAAGPGEFTLRAFLNGKMDLSQAEAVADVIAANSESSHELAMSQMRGGFSNEIQKLRNELIHFASLIELELDFGEEDVEFADRDDLKELVLKLNKALTLLINSFDYGNVIKTGVPVAIVGEPNVGKSTLLNALLNEERAIVSDIAGTTRDTIEDEIVINGISYRFIDTAGIRETTDEIEGLGIKKSFEKIDSASIILLLVDASSISKEQLKKDVNNIENRIEGKNKRLIVIANKIDKSDLTTIEAKFEGIENVIFTSAKELQNIDNIKEQLYHFVKDGVLQNTDVIVTNARHFEALSKANESLIKVLEGLDVNITGDFLAMDIRQALHQLGEITGEITTDDLLDNIFSKFCIGK